MNKTYSDRNISWTVSLDRSTLEALAVISILVSSAVLRCWNITVGLPTLYVHDEIFEVHRALELLRGEYDFVRLKGMYFYLLSFLSGAYGILLIFQGYFSSLEEFVAYSMVNPGNIVLMSRLICVTLGTLSIYLVFRLGQKIFSANSYCPLLLALAWATCGLAIWTSKWGLIETLVMVFGLSAFFPILKLFEHANGKSYAWAGFFIAATTATKVYGVLLFLPLVFAHVVVHKGNTIRKFVRELFHWKLGVSFSVFFISLVILNPVLFLTVMGSGEVIQKLSVDAEEIYPLAFYFKILRWNLSNMGFCFFVIGLIAASVRFEKRVCACALFALSFLLALGLKKEAVLIYDRYLLIGLPLFFVVAVYGADALFRWIHNWLPAPRLKSFVIPCGVLMAAMGFSLNSVPMLLANPVMEKKYTPVYEEARVWFEENIPEGATVVIRGENRPWPGNQSLPIFDMKENYLNQYQAQKKEGKSHAEIGYMVELAKAKGITRYNLINETRYVIWKHPEEYIHKNGAEYFVVDVEYFAGQAGAKRSLKAMQSRNHFYQLLREMKDVELVKTFQGLGVTGVPRNIEIYQAKKSNDPLDFGNQHGSLGGEIPELPPDLEGI